MTTSPVRAATGLLLLGHGSRDPLANAEFEALVEEYRVARPGIEVTHGYVELAQPHFADALRDLAGRVDHVVVVPLFLFAAGHVKNDVPLALVQARRDTPGVRFTAARALGVQASLVDLAFERARSALEEVRDPANTALVVIGRGSSDPDANGDFFKVVRLLSEGRGFAWAVPCFIGITRPRFEEAAELVARARPERIVVVPYFLFAGSLIGRIQAQVESFRARCPWVQMVLAPHLGSDPRVFELIDDRLREAVEGERPLPCDTCQYRAPISGVTGNVGGIKALLWSLRHSFTHTQATPHVHAHRPLTKHVFVCGNVDCADRGSVPLISALRRRVKEAGRDRDIRVTRTHCMGRCGEGPAVAVYPDGIWYRGVTELDATELVDRHLLKDELVGRLVDDILQ